jgi:hypothetical protein
MVVPVTLAAPRKTVGRETNAARSWTFQEPCPAVADRDDYR